MVDFKYLTDNKGAFYCVQESPAMVLSVIVQAGEFYTIGVSTSAKKVRRLLEHSFFVACSKIDFHEKLSIAQKQITATRQLLNT